MKKSPITDRLDDMVKASNNMIDGYQIYEKEFANLWPMIRNYIDDKFTRTKHQEILAIKEHFEKIVIDFKRFKKEQHNELDALMQNYLDKYDEHIDNVMYAINTRITLQHKLLTKNGTLIGNIALMRKMKNTIDLCLISGLEVNRTVARIKQKAQQVY